MRFGIHHQEFVIHAMGWFLTSANTIRKPRGHWAKLPRDRRPYDPARWWRRLWVGCSLLLLGLLGAGLVFGQHWLKQHVGQLRGRDAQVHFIDAPPWLGQQRLQELASSVAQIAGDNPLDDRPLARAAEWLAANPWIAQVVRITRNPDGVIGVHARYRVPAALVEARDGLHLVDSSVARLPGVYPYEQVRQLGLSVIIGVSAAPPAEGHAWPGGDVAAGVKMAMLVEGQPWAAQVRAIDVSNYDGRMRRDQPHLTLWTDRGAVRWGRAPGEEGVYEPPASQKLAILQRVAQIYRGRIDAEGQVVDVFLDAPMIHPHTRLSYTARW